MYFLLLDIEVSAEEMIAGGFDTGLDISLLIAFCTNSLQGLIVAVLLPVNYLHGHNLP